MSSPTRTSMSAIEGFEEFEFSADGTTRRVFHTGTGPGVILMHEIPGLTPQTFGLGRRIAARGYTVFLPLLFGKPGQRPSWPRMVARVCISNEFYCFAKHRSSPVTDWLRALCREVHARCGGPGVGAVGMCVTGGFVLSMMLEPALMAPVICQPALPFVPVGSRGAALGIAPAELEQAAARARQEELTVLGMRFRGDWICPRARFDTLERTFGEHFERIEVSPPRRLRGLISDPAHSVLVYFYVDRPGHPTHAAFERMIALFDQQVGS